MIGGFDCVRVPRCSSLRLRKVPPIVELTDEVALARVLLHCSECYCHNVGNASDAKHEKFRPWVGEVLVYVVGGALLVLGGYVWVVRASAKGDWTLRLSQLWDSLGLISLGLAVVAIGLTLTILRVQNREAARADRETTKRQGQHEEVLRRVEAIAERTHVAVSETGEDVKDMKQLLGSQFASAQAASRSETEAELEPGAVAKAEADAPEDELDEVSLEGVRDGDVSSLPLETHVLGDSRLIEPIKTAGGVFYPVGAVPVGVLADLVEAWEAESPDVKRWKATSKANWTISRVVGAYRSYSPAALAKGRRNLSGSPWFVTFRDQEKTLVTYYLSRNGKKRAGEAEKRPVVKRLVGEGADARWVPLNVTPDAT